MLQGALGKGLMKICRVLMGSALVIIIGACFAVLGIMGYYLIF